MRLVKKQLKGHSNYKLQCLYSSNRSFMCATLLCNFVVQLCCATLLCNFVVQLCCATLLCNFVVQLYHVTLFINFVVQLFLQLCSAILFPNSKHIFSTIAMKRAIYVQFTCNFANIKMLSRCQEAVARW
jgi:hypothetical protein